MTASKKTVLAVDDTEINIDILLGLLDEEYDVLVALNGPQALEIVSEESVDLILLDIMMPEMSGFEVCGELKKRPETRDIPVIFITAKSDDASLEEAFDKGGADYVTKPFRPVELLTRIKTHIDLRSAHSELEYLTHYDALTGIHNRRGFFQRVESLTGTQAPLYAVMITIEELKTINLAYGRAAGDAVLKHAAQTLQSLTTNTAVLGRLGGKAFAIVGNTENGAIPLALTESLRNAASGLSVQHLKGEIRFTLNTGIALHRPAEGSLDMLLREAENALFNTKQDDQNPPFLRENG